MKLFRVLDKMADDDTDYVFSIFLCAAVILCVFVGVLATFVSFEVLFPILVVAFLAGLCAPAVIGVVKYWNKVD